MWPSFDQKVKEMLQAACLTVGVSIILIAYSSSYYWQTDRQTDRPDITWPFIVLSAIRRRRTSLKKLFMPFALSVPHLVLRIQSHSNLYRVTSTYLESWRVIWRNENMTEAAIGRLAADHALQWRHCIPRGISYRILNNYVRDNLQYCVKPVQMYDVMMWVSAVTTYCTPPWRTGCSQLIAHHCHCTTHDRYHLSLPALLVLLFFNTTLLLPLHRQCKKQADMNEWCHMKKCNGKYNIGQYVLSSCRCGVLEFQAADVSGDARFKEE